MAAAKGNNYSALRKKNPTYTKEQIAKIIDDLLDWASEGEGIFLATYIYKTYKRAPGWLNQLGEHHPEVKEALQVAKELIAGKVGNHCFIGDRNSAFGEKILPIYSKEYKDLLKWKASLTQQAQQATLTTPQTHEVRFPNE